MDRFNELVLFGSATDGEVARVVRTILDYLGTRLPQADTIMVQVLYKDADTQHMRFHGNISCDPRMARRPADLVSLHHVAFELQGKRLLADGELPVSIRFDEIVLDS